MRNVPYNLQTMWWCFCKAGKYDNTAVSFLRAVSAVNICFSSHLHKKHRNNITTDSSQEKSTHIISNESQPWLESIIRLQQWTPVSSVNSNQIKEWEWPNKCFRSPVLLSLIKEFLWSLRCSVFFANAHISGWLKADWMLARLWWEATGAKASFSPPGQRGFK